MTNRGRYDPERHQRQTNRKPEWDYGGPGRYFVTVCSFDRELIFGEIANGSVHLSEIGTIVDQAWLEIAVANPHVTLDSHIVMPNHLHGIVIIPPNNWTKRTAESGGRPAGTASGSLGAILGRFKSVATRRVNLLPNVGSSTIWQRGYHDRVIRDEGALIRARQYIVNNPSNWLRDPEHPRHAHRQSSSRR